MDSAERRARIYMAVGYPPDILNALRSAEREERRSITVPRLARLYAVRGYLQAAQYLLSLAAAYAEPDMASEIHGLVEKSEELIWRLNSRIARELEKMQRRRGTREGRAELGEELRA